MQGKNHNTLLGCFIQEYEHVFDLNWDNWGVGGQNENYWDKEKLNNHRNGPVQKMEQMERNNQKIPTQ